MAKVGKSTYFGWNSEKTNPKLYRVNKYGFELACFHAETHVLYKIPKAKRRKAKIFVARLKNDGSFTMSKPCLHCILHLKNEGVLKKNIWYTNHSGEWICLKKNDYLQVQKFT